MNRSIALSALLVLLHPFGAGSAQTEPSTIPASIKLLPGYHYEKEVGVDTYVGKIWKKGGVEIEHDIGALAGNYADCKTCGWNDGELWRKKQTVNGQEAIVVLTKSKRAYRGFPGIKS